MGIAHGTIEKIIKKRVTKAVQFENERHRILIQGQHTALDLLANGKPLHKVLEVLILTMEKYLQDAICSILLYDEEKNSLCLVSAPSMTTSMRKAMHIIPIGPDEGSCGSAAYHQNMIIVEDITLDPNWDRYRVVPQSEGFRACWSKPVFSSKSKLLGTFAVYYKQKKQPSTEELNALTALTNLTGVAIERFEMEQSLHTLQASNDNRFTSNDSSLHKDLAKAALRRDEFTLHYQPLFDLSNQSISGVEALIRWNHPSLGIIPPCDFIPLAEKNGMIIPIGEHVLKMACEQKNDWARKGFQSLNICVNVSPVQLEDEGFVEKVQSILATFEIEPYCLFIEITESILIQPKTMTTIQRLSDIGIRISIDDFGMGYSSLSYLKQLPIQRIKIDRSFIKNIPKSKQDMVITRTILDMCSTLQLEVVAEGVETEEQYIYLSALECNYIQGYYISKPIPPAVFEKRFLHNQKISVGSSGEDHVTVHANKH